MSFLSFKNVPHARQNSIDKWYQQVYISPVSNTKTFLSKVPKNTILVNQQDTGEVLNFDQ